MTDTYHYASNSNMLTSISHGATTVISFTYNDLGSMTQMVEDADGTTVVAGATYGASGLAFYKEDYTVEGATVTVGDTVFYGFATNAEMVMKVGVGGVIKTNTYDLSGRLLEELWPMSLSVNPTSNEPIVSHIWLGDRIVATVTGKGDACFIATAALGTGLSDDLDVYMAFRDRVLKRFDLGKSFINWYYDKGPTGATWLKAHDNARTATRWVLTAAVVPLKVALFGNLVFIIIVFLCVLCASVVIRKLGWSWRRSLSLTFSLAFATVTVYSLFIDVPEAGATYTEQGIYYYTADNLGRPFNVHDDSGTLRWYERHYPFGETIVEDDTPDSQDPISIGGGTYTETWSPNLRFPGQYEDDDMGAAYNSRSFFVQNHYREYMPRFGRYNRVDPLVGLLISESPSNPYSLTKSKCSSSLKNSIAFNRYLLANLSQGYIYGKSNSILLSDRFALYDKCAACCGAAAKCLFDNCMFNPLGWEMVGLSAAIGGFFGSAAGPEGSLGGVAIGGVIGATSFEIGCITYSSAAYAGCKSGCDPCYGCDSSDLCVPN